MNTTIKKILAVTVMAGFGLTAFGHALTLADYPSPFVNNAIFDGKIVIGEKANVIDVLGATDIAASLQREASTAVEGTTGGAEVSEGIKIAATGTVFGYTDTIGDIDPTLDDTDLVLLADGNFNEAKETKNDVDYTQKITFNTTHSAALEFAQKDTGTEDADTYLHFTDGNIAYNYTLTFDNSVEYINTTTTTINDDFEGAKIVIQGNSYTITGATGTANGPLTKLTMMAGDTNKWLSQGDTLNVGDHEISITSVDEDGTKCGVKVDGTTQWIDVSDEGTFGDLTIGVLDAVPVHAAGAGTAPDSCELTIGSTEVILENAQAIKVGGDTIDGTNVVFGGTAGNLDTIEITYEPDEDIYLAKGETFVDPALGNFKFVFDGVVSGASEEMKMTTTADDGTFKLNNINGLALNIPFVDNDAAISPGDKLYSELASTITIFLDTNSSNDGVQDSLETTEQVGNLVLVDDMTCESSASEEDCEGIKFLAVSTGGEARIIKITNIDTTNNELDLYDETTSKTIEDKDYTDGTATSIDLGFTTVSIEVDETNDYVSFSDINAFAGDTTAFTGTFVSGLGAEIGLNFIEAEIEDNFSVYIANVDGYNLTSVSGTVNASFNLMLDADDDMVIDEGAGLTWITEKEDSDYQMAADTYNWGTIFKYDSEDQNDFTITYNEEEADAQVFVTPLLGEITSTAGTSGVALNPIAVGMAIMDKDATLGSKAYIVVGGPCANTVAAELMGNPEDCAADFSEGKATIKLYAEQNALLVAGYSGADTQGASRVLANYGDYALTGTEVEVVTANLNSLSVNSIQ